MKQLDFSIRDASAMLAIARSAPINNMNEAEARSILFAKFQAWAQVMLSPPVAGTEAGKAPNPEVATAVSRALRPDGDEPAPEAEKAAEDQQP